MKTLQRLTASALSALLVLFSSGIAPYQALAQTVTQSVQAVPGGVGALGVSGAALARPQGFSGAVDVKIGLASTVLPSASTPKLQAAASPTSIIVPGVQVSESIGLKAELKNGRRMPVERDTRDDGSPDDTDDLDDLGNPRRD
ncbi:MAG TPA: hypothetical protein DCM05_10735, partial [Elusimicrobia bacterium]|nr:hypothetical protein [Elusimicrobiota bacterium]